MVSQELESITASGLIQNGILNPQDLTDRQRSLMDKYMRYKQDWQSVSLVLSHDTPRTGCSEAVVINRPLARFVNKSLATLLMGKANDKDLPYDFLDRLVQAFGQQAAVYAGGPHAQDQPALLVHGLAELDGATELAPGLYTGGLTAAVEGVLAGTYQPLDFRFFVGRWQYDPKQHPEYGTLASRVQEGAYQCVACARSLALKQCLGLPKPLFHEGECVRGAGIDLCIYFWTLLCLLTRSNAAFIFFLHQFWNYVAANSRPFPKLNCANGSTSDSE